MPQLLLPNLTLLNTVLSPKPNINPAIFPFPTHLKTHSQITILPNIITFTPRTLLIDISHHPSILYIHPID
ncbi:Na+/H+ antiporter subunit E, partial [Bacillus pumilus]|uniref:Na+/H+ antiporter subunit E n=1 Tax=Bacillus pumilus TaxID=1408 RepID=UPI0021B1FD36